MESRVLPKHWKTIDIKWYLLCFFMKVFIINILNHPLNQVTIRIVRGCFQRDFWQSNRADSWIIDTTSSKPFSIQNAIITQTHIQWAISLIRPHKNVEKSLQVCCTYNGKEVLIMYFKPQWLRRMSRSLNDQRIGSIPDPASQRWSEGL